MIEDVTDAHAIIINRNKSGSMIIPGDTLGVSEVTPALFAAVAANEAERAAPGVTLVDVSMIGAAGRIYLSGSPADVRRGAARDHRGALGGDRAGRVAMGQQTMTEHDLSAGGDVMTRVRGCAQDALAAYGGHPAASVELLNVSENATFLVTDPDAGPSVLRVHRLGYHTEPEIASELAWMDALRAEAGVRTPRVLPAADGRRVVTVPERGGRDPAALRPLRVPARHRAGRLGAADDPALAAAHFAELGEITARMHRHAREWDRPAWFTRFHWDYAAAFGEPGPLGPLAGRHRRRAVRARDPQPGWTTLLRDRLRAFGSGPERYGLVHADTRLANLLVHDGAVSVIDFDDAGFSWYLYDLGTSVSFFEHEPQVPGLVDAWLRGLPAGREAVRRGRGGDLDVHHVPAAAAGRVDRLAPGASTSPPSSAPGTRGAAATWRRSYLSTH